jgi:hypothetical protein
MKLLMQKREVKKELMRFVRKEVKEKGADWGELRRVKKQVMLTKGFPNIPNLVLQTETVFSYVVIIIWKKEIRLYFFDSNGISIQGQSFYKDLDKIYMEIKGKSKKIARFPSPEKPITIQEINSQLDKQFKQIWVQVANLLGIPKKTRHHRPLIKGSKKKGEGIFGTEIKDNFIHIPLESPKTNVIFAYFSFYYFLPLPIQQNNDISEALIFLFLQSFKQFKKESPDKERNSYNIFQELTAKWRDYSPRWVLDFLRRVSKYYDITWETSDFMELLNLPLSIIKKASRQNLPELFCQIYSRSRNEDFNILSKFLGLPFNVECVEEDSRSVFSNEKLINLYKWVQTWEFSKVLLYLEKDDNILYPGLEKAFLEALNFQYANVLALELKTNTIMITNKSDLIIILESTSKIFPDGIEESITLDKLILKPKSLIQLNLEDLFGPTDFPIRFNYYIVKSVHDIGQPVFKGTLVI